MTRLRRHLSYSNVVSSLCLFLLLGGGAAWANHEDIFSDDIVDGEVKHFDLAANSVGTGKIVNGSVQGLDIADSTVASVDLQNGQVRSADVANDTTTGALTGTDVANNSLKGADIDESTLDIGDAARAYAVVNPATCTGTPGTCTAEESKGISSVTRDFTGQYCVTAPGIDATVTPAAVTVDVLDTAEPDGNASAMANEGSGCGASGQGFRVVTDRQPNTSATTVGPADVANDVAFTIVIP
jgi:hypothetical protein